MTRSLALQTRHLRHKPRIRRRCPRRRGRWRARPHAAMRTGRTAASGRRALEAKSPITVMSFCPGRRAHGGGQIACSRPSSARAARTRARCRRRSRPPPRSGAGRDRPSWPSTIASAAATLWIATRWLATNFILLPLPKAPRSWTLRAKPRNAGSSALDRRRVAAGIDDEILDLRLRAGAGHRAIERRCGRPRAGCALNARLVVERQRAGLDDGAPGSFAPAAISRAVASTARGVGRLVMMSLAASATAAALARRSRRRPPCASAHRAGVDVAADHPPARRRRGSARTRRP